ncbi:hypothetical protein GCWU000341_02510 [Oribacterium sp. oral taxon 078 str. F0262]|nr:hypothetical protein GCWU000341_02510 [Oribacterium sp. oral taxon 078 str. F0262]
MCGQTKRLGGRSGMRIPHKTYAHCSALQWHLTIWRDDIGIELSSCRPFCRLSARHRTKRPGGMKCRCLPAPHEESIARAGRKR